MIKFLYDFIPVLLFFIVFRFAGIYAATLTGMIATALQVALYYAWTRKLDHQQLLTLVIFLIFGGMTLYFHNPLFVKWKPTVLFWIMATVFLLSSFFGKKPLLQRMMEKSMTDSPLEQTVWHRLTRVWAIFFALLGAMNLYVASQCSTETWVNFKFYGITGLLLLFCLGQAVWLSTRMIQKKD